MRLITGEKHMSIDTVSFISALYSPQWCQHCKCRLSDSKCEHLPPESKLHFWKQSSSLTYHRMQYARVLAIMRPFSWHKMLYKTWACPSISANSILQGSAVRTLLFCLPQAITSSLDDSGVCRDLVASSKRRAYVVRGGELGRRLQTQILDTRLLRKQSRQSRWPVLAADVVSLANSSGNKKICCFIK